MNPGIPTPPRSRPRLTQAKSNNNYNRSKLRLFPFSIFLFPFAILPGCRRAPAAPTVVLYTSIDQPVAAPILADFTRESGIQVTLVTDTEATKSAGLTERLRAEKDNPQADVFWNNEPFRTVNLADEGVLAPYDSPSAADVPAQYKDPNHRWAANALRARVIAESSDHPVNIKSIEDLARPQFQDHVAMARPTAGTTGGHVAALYVLWGDAKARDYFRALRANNIKLLGGNSIVAESIARGGALAGLTDNDDVYEASTELKKNVVAVLPDQTAFGTLLIPTTVCLVTGAKHDQQARRLIDYLLSKQVEQKLLEAHFAGWSIRDLKSAPKSMNVNYTEVARIMPQAVRESTAILEGRE